MAISRVIKGIPSFLKEWEQKKSKNTIKHLAPTPKLFQSVVSHDDMTLQFFVNHREEYCGEEQHLITFIVVTSEFQKSLLNKTTSLPTVINSQTKTVFFSPASEKQIAEAKSQKVELSGIEYHSRLLIALRDNEIVIMINKGSLYAPYFTTVNKLKELRDDKDCALLSWDYTSKKWNGTIQGVDYILNWIEHSKNTNASRFFVELKATNIIEEEDTIKFDLGCEKLIAYRSEAYTREKTENLDMSKLSSLTYY